MSKCDHMPFIDRPDLQNVHSVLDDVIIWKKSQCEHSFYFQKALQQVR